MPIVQSVIADDKPQVDSRRSIVERHVDHVGQEYVYHWLAEPTQNVSVALAARAAALPAQLTEWERDRNLGELLGGRIAAVRYDHQTKTEFIQWMRGQYGAARGEAVGRMAAWFLTLTDQELRAAFGMTQSQVNALKSTMQTRVNELSAVLSAAGA